VKSMTPLHCLKAEACILVHTAIGSTVVVVQATPDHSRIRKDAHLVLLLALKIEDDPSLTTNDLVGL